MSEEAKAVVMPLDVLSKTCGYFNFETEHGCDHPDNEETTLVKLLVTGNTEKINLEYQITLAAMRKKYGSVRKIIDALQTQDGKKYIKSVKTKLHDKEFVTQFGCKLQGCCSSFSCPIAYECDLEDLKEHDQDYYEEWKNSRYGPYESGANLMLVYNKEEGK